MKKKNNMVFISILSLMLIISPNLVSSLNENNTQPISVLSIGYVNDPQSGAVWFIGERYDITWSSTDVLHVDIDLYKDGTYVQGIASYTSSDGVQHWTVSSVTPGDDYQIRVTNYDDVLDYDESSYFTIASAPSSITYPDGSLLYKGLTYDILWAGNGGTVTIDLHESSYPHSYQFTIADTVSNDGQYSWTIPNDVPDNSYKVKITATTDSSLNVYSSSFYIGDLPSDLLSPGDGSIYFPGQYCSITWTGESGYVSIDLYRDSAYVMSISDSTSNDGYYSWKVPSGLIGIDDYYIHLYPEDDTSHTIVSGRFTIGTLPVFAVFESSKLERGHNFKITWSGYGGNVEIELYLSSSKLTTITLSSPNNGSYTWKVPETLQPDDGYRFKIYPVGISTSYDYSDYLYIFDDPPYSFTAPISNELMFPGYDYNIKWKSFEGYVGIDLYLNGSFVRTITSRSDDDGIYEWGISEYYGYMPSYGYQFKIYNYYISTEFAYSETFSIGQLPEFHIDSTFTIYEKISEIIEWEGSKGNVEIEVVYRSDSSNYYNKYTITESTMNDGLFYWIVPENVFRTDSSENYYYRITLLEADYEIVSRYSFSVREAYVECPENIIRGNTVTIQWNIPYTIDSITLELWNNDVKILTIAASIPKSSSFSWIVPTDIPPANTYRIKLLDSNDLNVFILSDLITISVETVKTEESGIDNFINIGLLSIALLSIFLKRKRK